MKKIKEVLPFTFVILCFGNCKGQKSFGKEELNLKQSISLQYVKGRIDHIAVNLKDSILYVAALGNNSLEVVDLKNYKVIHSISGLDEPQGVAYIPQTNEVMVANGGNGICNFYNAANYEKRASVKLGSDADDVRYDSVSKKIYAGYGDGGVAVIDALQHKKIADGKLPAHPEGFQLDSKLNRLFVNVPDANKIIVFSVDDLRIISEWATEYRANFPMTIDEKDHIIFIGYRRPAKLVAINEATGKTIASADLISDIDDLFYNAQTNKIYSSGGGGAVNVFSFINSKLEKVASISTRDGARTSLLIPSLNSFILAERANGSRSAELQVYLIKN